MFFCGSIRKKWVKDSQKKKEKWVKEQLFLIKKKYY